ncbi:hypothetical protein J2S42_001121 [Catenuloplanes indicus]|uniref:Uncharacterized protein n=1 Tax=Catenuloplanes indicus TaxID=137267 RepID=A0AAE3VVN3_9ACTN|nr:hypothetical protein [Catenuloplanes indicus]
MPIFRARCARNSWSGGAAPGPVPHAAQLKLIMDSELGSCETSHRVCSMPAGPNERHLRWPGTRGPPDPDSTTAAPAPGGAARPGPALHGGDAPSLLRGACDATSEISPYLAPPSGGLCRRNPQGWRRRLRAWPAECRGRLVPDVAIFRAWGAVVAGSVVRCEIWTSLAAASIRAKRPPPHLDLQSRTDGRSSQASARLGRAKRAITGDAACTAGVGAGPVACEARATPGMRACTAGIGPGPVACEARGSRAVGVHYRC